MNKLNLQEVELWRGISWDTNEWVKGFIIQAPGVYTKIVQLDVKDGEVYDHYTRIVPETASRFAMIYDKNGTPIFEGDILIGQESISNTVRVLTGTSSLRETRTVSWTNDIRHIVEYTPSGLQLASYYAKFCKVSGNIYDATYGIETCVNLK